MIIAMFFRSFIYFNMADTPPNHQVLTIRRSTRSALAEIPDRLGGLQVAENAGIPAQPTGWFCK